MDEKYVELCLNMAEKPIKQMIKSYLIMFKKEALLDICEKLQVSSRKIPQEYINYADLSDSLPDRFLQSNSLLKIPKDTGEVKFAYDEMYSLSLGIVEKDIIWDESIFEPLGDKVKEVKNYISKLISMAQYVFNMLKPCKELDSLSLEVDPVNITLYIKDRRFPNYQHPYRVGISLKRLN